ncbi:MAG: hypothetical protein GX575_02770 [Candidatus Anammoximicrobium sp.]|nr:hypothetical protein [Candidatus Anammoximicrobium sp.]
MAHLLVGWYACGLLAASSAADPGPLAELRSQVPSSPAQLTATRVADVAAAADGVLRWVAEQPLPADSPPEILASIERLLEIHAQVNGLLEQTFAMRVQFAGLPAGDERHARLRLYLRLASQMIDLSGRLHTALREAIEVAAYHLDSQPQQFQRLLELLVKNKAAAGAEVMSYMLFDPPADSGASPYSTQEKYQLLNLILATRHHDLLPYVAAFLREAKNPSLIVIAAELVRRLGLPQEPRPGNVAERFKPPILAGELHRILTQVSESDLPEHLVAYRRELLAWLQRRMQRGIEEDSLKLGALELLPGDWLLMRNPSPYNLFTDLSPGLFTHVGVVAVEQGRDGIRRFVIVDLPERGAEIPATNVEAFLARTLHYVFLRHPDAEVGRHMGQAAADMIGNESQFDLQFDTSRVAALQGKPLRGELIHTYCAGFLLACTLPTSRPREEFFPITEAVAGGNMAANLKKLGLSFGRDFLSPTGAMFSPQLSIVGRREPVYDPGREVQELIFNHFADGMIRKTLTPSPDAFQILREKLARMAKQVPWVANALARANDVNARMDLEAAARTAAVIETLDDIAEENLNEFVAAYTALLAGPLHAQSSPQHSADQIARIQDYRQRHAKLAQQRSDGRLSPRELRLELVRFYADRGRRQLDERFFAASAAGAATDQP